MLLIQKIFKNIFTAISSFQRQLLKLNLLASILVTLLLAAPINFAFAFNPFLLKKEFEEKLTAQQIMAVTYFYASGTRFHIGQNISTEDLKKIFLAQNYRFRESSQSLLPLDFQVLEPSECSSVVQQNLPEAFCFIWINKTSTEGFILTLENQSVSGIYNLSPPIKSTTEAFLEAPLIAQYRNNQPLMQEDRSLSDIPVACLNATMAIEDNDFLNHSGVSYTGIFRAAVKNILAMRKAQGGSTITQQLVKNYFLTPEKSYTRKMKEFYMALKLESQWTKDEILQTYLNIIYMGQSGAYQVRGFPAASRAYFDKIIDQLDLPQCALLAAMINGPAKYHPWRNPENALQRRNFVLTKMKALNLISEKEFTKATKASLPSAIEESKALVTAPYFFEAALEQAKELGIDPAGKAFYTSLDIRLQAHAQKAITDEITKLTLSRKKLSAKKEQGLKLQSTLVSADNQTGLVRVFVGGENYLQTQYNRALNSKRQIGSLMKPFVYLSGLIYADYKPDSLLNDSKWEWKYDRNKTWAPNNYDKKFRGEVPYYYALKESLNVPTAQIAEKAGIENVVEIARKAGLTSNIPALPAASLGTSEHTSLEVLQAYQTLARSGYYQKLSFLYKIIDSNNKVIYQYSSESEEELNPKHTRMLVEMMKYGIINGTGKFAGHKGYAHIAAGKTGTTSQGRDAWFAGFTPLNTTVVWLGFDRNEETHLTGASGAVPIWTEFMLKAYGLNNSTEFPSIEGLTLKEFHFPKVNESVWLLEDN